MPSGEGMGLPHAEKKHVEFALGLGLLKNKKREYAGLTRTPCLKNLLMLDILGSILKW